MNWFRSSTEFARRWSKLPRARCVRPKAEKEACKKTDKIWENKSWKTNFRIKFSREATHCLQYHLTHRGNYRNALSVPLNDWVRLSFAFAEHRMSPTVDECDVQQVILMASNKWSKCNSTWFCGRGLSLLFWRRKIRKQWERIALAH